MNVQEAINQRHSTRHYNTDKKVSREDIVTILEAGQKSPNGIGLEAWHFYVIENELDGLMNACGGQEHIGNSSFSVVITTPTEAFLAEHPEYLEKKILDNGLPQSVADMYLGYLKGKSGQYVYEQTSYPASYMALQAADLGIGSVIVGGFDNDKTLDLLGLDKEENQVGIVISFGYSDEPKKDRYNRPFDEIVTYV